jgi:hypothetical protein
VGPEESSLDAVTRQLKAKKEGKEPEPTPTRVDYMKTLYKRKYGEKAEAVILDAIEAREKMPEDLDEALAQELIDELEAVHQ